MKVKQEEIPETKPAETQMPKEEETSGQGNIRVLSQWVFAGIGILALAAAIGGFIWFRMDQAKKEKQARQARLQERRRRLQESGISMEEFDQLLKERQEKKKKEKG